MSTLSAFDQNGRRVTGSIKRRSYLTDDGEVGVRPVRPTNRKAHRRRAILKATAAKATRQAQRAARMRAKHRRQKRRLRLP